MLGMFEGCILMCFSRMVLSQTPTYMPSHHISCKTVFCLLTTQQAQSVKNPLLEQSLLLVSSNQKLTQSSPKLVVHDRLRSLVPLFLKAAENLRQNIDVNAKEDEGRVNISK